MVSKKRSPKIVSILKPLSPTDLGDTLVYEHLAGSVRKNEPFEQDRIDDVLEAEPHSIEEESAARQLAYHYLLKTAHQALNADSEKKKALWLDRYTKASIELFGAPSKKRAKALLAQQIYQFQAYRNNPHVNQEKLEEYLSWAENKADLGEAVHFERHEEDSMKELLDGIENYLEERYGTAIDVFDEKHDDKNSSADIKKKMDTALTKLVSIEPLFEQWQPKIIPNKDVISVDAETKTIQIGENRAQMTNLELKGLFCHEILVHALRSINGSKLDENLKFGLPDYLDSEEGLGTLFEYAITKQLPEKNADRYIDTAIALGVLGERMIPRLELLEYVGLRQEIRDQASGVQDEASSEIKTRAHVNRIYRGTPGEDLVGVFTKDIVYQEGFDSITAYIFDQLKEGKQIDEIFDFVLQGKFNPTSEKEVAYVSQMY